MKQKTTNAPLFSACKWLAAILILNFYGMHAQAQTLGKAGKYAVFSATNILADSNTRFEEYSIHRVTTIGKYGSAGSVTGPSIPGNNDSDEDSVSLAVSAMGTFRSWVNSQEEVTNVEYPSISVHEISFLNFAPGVNTLSNPLGEGAKSGPPLLVNTKLSDTLKFTGSATDFYVVKITGDFEVKANAFVKLGNVKPENIYWVVSRDVSIENGAVFSGNVVSARYIHGGRLRAGQVSLYADNNIKFNPNLIGREIYFSKDSMAAYRSMSHALPKFGKLSSYALLAGDTAKIDSANRFVDGKLACLHLTGTILYPDSVFTGVNIDQEFTTGIELLDRLQPYAANIPDTYNAAASTTAINKITINPGYTYLGSNVTISDSIFFTGTAESEYVIEASSSLTISSGVHMSFTGIYPSKILWRVFGNFSYTNTNFSGVVMASGKVNVSMGKGQTTLMAAKNIRSDSKSLSSVNASSVPYYQCTEILICTGQQYRFNNTSSNGLSIAWNPDENYGTYLGLPIIGHNLNSPLFTFRHAGDFVIVGTTTSGNIVIDVKVRDCNTMRYVPSGYKDLTPYLNYGGTGDLKVMLTDLYPGSSSVIVPNTDVLSGTYSPFQSPTGTSTDDVYKDIYLIPGNYYVSGNMSLAWKRANLEAVSFTFMSGVHIFMDGQAPKCRESVTENINLIEVAYNCGLTIQNNCSIEPAGDGLWGGLFMDADEVSPKVAMLGTSALPITIKGFYKPIGSVMPGSSGATGALDLHYVNFSNAITAVTCTLGTSTIPNVISHCTFVPGLSLEITGFPTWPSDEFIEVNGGYVDINHSETPETTSALLLNGVFSANNITNIEMDGNRFYGENAGVMLFDGAQNFSSSSDIFYGGQYGLYLYSGSASIYKSEISSNHYGLFLGIPLTDISINEAIFSGGEYGLYSYLVGTGPNLNVITSSNSYYKKFASPVGTGVRLSNGSQFNSSNDSFYDLTNGIDMRAGSSATIDLAKIYNTGTGIKLSDATNAEITNSEITSTYTCVDASESLCTLSACTLVNSNTATYLVFGDHVPSCTEFSGGITTITNCPQITSNFTGIHANGGTVHFTYNSGIACAAGMYLEACTSEVRKNIFNSINCIELGGRNNHATVTENLFNMGETAIYIKNDAALTTTEADDQFLKLNCNLFEPSGDVSDRSEEPVAYGIYLYGENTAIQEIGGTGLSSAEPPGGNIWPTSTTSRTTSPGSNIETAWGNTDNWYSIYNNNIEQQVKYNKYTNEFIGTVYPTVATSLNYANILISPNKCGTTYNITHVGGGYDNLICPELDNKPYFPTRLAAPEEGIHITHLSELEAESKIGYCVPNPASYESILKFEMTGAADELEANVVEIATGKQLMVIKPIQDSNQFQIPLNTLSSGIYSIKIQLSGVDVATRKLVVIK
ncbi:MAG: ice-binding family protein [Bacteroidota bacterium]